MFLSQPQTYKRLLIALAIAVTLLIASIALHTHSTSSSPSGADAVIGNGFPTLMVFNSPFCDLCAVHALQLGDLQNAQNGVWNFLTVDIHTGEGRDLRRSYGFNFTPEYVLFDADGVEIWRGHIPPGPDALIQITP